MNIAGIGLDLVEVTRIEDAVERFGSRFLNRIFDPEELAYAQSTARPSIHLAARFAAKEAVSKTFGTGIGKEFGWRDVKILREESGKPFAVLSPKALSLAHKMGADTVLVSLTHTETHAAAQAILIGS